MRTILLPLRGAADDDWAVETGLAVAASLGAHLTALLPRPDIAQVPVTGHYIATTGFAALVHEVRADAEAREARARELIEAAAERRSVRLNAEPDEPGPSIALVAPIGDEDALIRRWAAVHDLILYTRPSRPDGPLPAPAALKAALEHSGRPVLIVSDDRPHRFDSVAIAWNGSAEGARAATSALPFLRRAGRIVILTVATAKTNADEGERLHGYLRRHGLEAEIDSRRPHEAVGAELISAALEHRAELLVTGCYTHSRMRQSLFGGVTHHLLEHCRMPMLMAH